MYQNPKAEKDKRISFMNTNSNIIFRDDVDWDEDLRQWLEDHLKQYPNHTTEILARSQYIGVPRAALDSYLAQLYFRPKAMGGEGNNPNKSKIEDFIRAYRKKVGGELKQSSGNPFFNTTVWSHMSAALKIALNENAIVVVYGRPGIGKSRTLSEFALREMKTPPLRILCSRNINAGHFVKYIAKQIRAQSYGSIPDIELSICEKLEKRPYPLFVDQANYLPERSLGSICHFWEKTKIPIALVGTNDLYKKFMNSSLTEDVRAQLTSRIAIHHPLPELEIEEVKGIIQHYLGSEINDQMIAYIYKITGGIHRHIEMLIARIIDLKNKNVELLDSKKADMYEIINVAASRLML